MSDIEIYKAPVTVPLEIKFDCFIGAMNKIINDILRIREDPSQSPTIFKTFNIVKLLPQWSTLDLIVWIKIVL